MARLETSFVIFLVILSTAELSQAQNISTTDNTERFKRFNLAPEGQLTNEHFKNVHRALDFLLDDSDFQPLVIAFGYFGLRTEIHEIAMKYFAERQLDYYNFNIHHVIKHSVDFPTGLTWIIIANDYTLFQVTLCMNLNIWDASNRYIIFFLDKAKQADNWIHFFQNLWNGGRVYKIVISSINEHFRYFHRYLPFDKTGEEYGIVQRLDMEKEICYDQERSGWFIGWRINHAKCPWQKRNESRWRETHFEDFRNLNGYPIHVTVFPSMMMEISRNEKNGTIYTKLDANVMKVIEKHMSSNFIVTVLEMRNKMDPFDVTLRKFDKDDKLDFVFTAYFMKAYKGKFHFTAGIFEDKLCLVAPSAAPVPKFLLPLTPFPGKIWFLLLIYNFIAALLWLLIRRLEAALRRDTRRTNNDITVELSRPMRSHPNDRKTRYLGFDNYRSSVSGQNRRFDRTAISNEPPKIHRGIVRFFDLLLLMWSPLKGGTTNAERAFLIGTQFISLIMIGLYQSYLVTSLTDPIFYPEIRTLHDVAESNRTIVTKYGNLVRDFMNDESPDVERLRSKIKILGRETRTYDSVVYGDKIALGRSSAFALRNLTKYVDPEYHRPLLHMVEECPTTYSLAYVVKRSSPYLERINDLLLRMTQAGLIEKWYDDMQGEVRIAVSKTRLKRYEKRDKLQFSHLSLAFIGLWIGLLFCTIVLLGEIYFSRKFRVPANR